MENHHSVYHSVSLCTTLSTHLSTTLQLLERSSKTKIQIISEAFKTECVETCKEKHQLKCAKSILRNNRINQYFFACALRNALIKGRQKNNNILIVGPTNCGKSFLLDPLELIFNVFVNPATWKYTWTNLENKDLAFPNDFRWSPECIAWSDFLLLLEGQTVNLPRPKNQFATDLLIDQSNNFAVFATSKTLSSMWEKLIYKMKGKPIWWLQDSKCFLSIIKLRTRV